MKTFFGSLVCVLLVLKDKAFAVPARVEERAVTTTSAAPVCPTGDFLVNGAFYGYPNQDTYAPWTLTHTSGSTGCRYIHNSYTPCLGNGGFGSYDPDCFECSYDAKGGSDTISQTVSLTPGCTYTLEATVACDHGADTATPHVFFRVTLDHDIIIPQQLSCPACTSQSQDGCQFYSDPIYHVVSGTVTGPLSGKGTIKVLVSQPAESVAVMPFLLTAVRLYRE